MGTNSTESFGEKITEFFTQHKDDYQYEKDGGDSRVPEGDRHGDPRREARLYARQHNEADPYPEDGPLDEGEQVSNPSDT